MYNTILVPLDGSERAEAILSHVEDLSQLYSAKVVLLEVAKAAPLLGWDEVIDMSLYKQKRDQERKRMECYLAGQQKRFLKKGIEAQICIDYGSVVNTILSKAHEVKADLIAIASHGLNDLYKQYYGSVAVGLLKKTDLPLLILRSPCTAEEKL